MHLDPASLSPNMRYRLLIGGIVPRPIALVSTRSISGALNLAPFSFFAGVGSNPMTLLFCPANKADGGEKDTLRNCKLASEGGTGNFVVNIVPMVHAPRMAACAEELAFGASEFDLSGFTPTPMPGVPEHFPPRVRECPVSYACATRTVLRTNPGAPGGGNIVVGEVVSVYVDDNAINEKLHIDPATLDAVGRMAGLTYCTTRERLEFPWERAALEKK